MLIGEKQNSRDAIALKNMLIDPTGIYCLSADNVKLHPSNDHSAALVDCGLEVLGSPISSDEYKHAYILDKLELLNTDARLLADVDDPQIKFLLLYHCYSKKFTYLLRTVAPCIT